MYLLAGSPDIPTVRDELEKALPIEAKLVILLTVIEDTPFRTRQNAQIINVKTASTPQIIEGLAAAKLIYLADYNLVEPLQNASVLETLKQADQAGTLIAGFGQGAMSLTQNFYNATSGKLETGLGLVNLGLFVPLFNTTGRNWLKALTKFSETNTIIGADDKVAVAGSDHKWEVKGRGWVTVYQDGQPRKFQAGQSFRDK